MDCPNCVEAMTHVFDSDEEDMDGRKFIGSHLQCLSCDTFLIVYTPIYKRPVWPSFAREAGRSGTTV